MNTVDENKPVWTMPKACELTGVNISQCHKWIREGYLKPAEQSPAKGRPNRFSFFDLIKLSVFKKLGEFRMLSVGAVAPLLGGLDFSKEHYKKTLCIGPDPNSNTAWETKTDSNPRPDEEVVFTINIELIRDRLLKII